MKTKKNINLFIHSLVCMLLMLTGVMAQLTPSNPNKTDESSSLSKPNLPTNSPFQKGEFPIPQIPQPEMPFNPSAMPGNMMAPPVPFGAPEAFRANELMTVRNLGLKTDGEFPASGLKDVSQSTMSLTGNYTMTDLGTGGGCVTYYPHKVNNNGDVIGHCYEANGGYNRAFLYRNGQIIILTLGGSYYSYPYAINDNGDVVGYSYTANNQAQHAFLYRNGQMIDLGTFGGIHSNAHLLNENGDVAGWAHTANNQQRAFLYRNGQMIDLGTLGGTYSYASAINDNGDVAGWANTAGGYNHAFLYRNGQMIDLGTLGGNYSESRAINNNGDVAGISYTAGNQYQQAFLYRNGQMINLGTFGGTYSYPQAINDNGDVVGYAYTANNQSYRAFLYRNGQMIDLGTLGGTHSNAHLLSENGDVAGWAYTAGNQYQQAFLYRNGQMINLGTFGGTYSYPQAINDNGDVVGYAYTANNQSHHAFLYRNGQMIDLGTLGGSHSIARSINNNGDVTGYALTANNQYWRGFIAKTNANTAPTALADAFSTDEDNALSVPASGVLGNDTDAENNALSAVLVTGPANASSFTLNADGSFSYVPNGDFNGTDSFTYKANDGQADSVTVTVTITVNAVNDAPAAAVDSYSTDEDTALVVGQPGSLNNDTDADGDALNAALVSGPSQAASFTFNADGSFTYTPNADFSGTDQFTYKANDGQADSSPATVTITVNAVNDAPNAVADSYSTDEDLVLNVIQPGALGNDTDKEFNMLNAVLVSGPAQASNFALNADGSFTYTPNPNFNGTDSFSYMANDGQADSNVVTVTITVNAVNDAPSLGNVPPSATIDELVAYGFTASASDIDNAGQTLAFSLVNAPAGASIDPVTGVFNWTPSEAQGPGSFSFTVRVSDGELNTDADISVTVNEVNVAPTLSGVPDAATIDELSAYAFTAAATDADVPAQSLTFSLDGAPAGAGIDPASGQFTWTPSEAQGNGSTYSFTVRVSDGVTQTDSPIALTVNEVNSAPVLAAVADQTIDEETALTGVAASATDSDDPANTLTYLLEVAPAGMTIDDSTGTISWTPTEEQGAGDYPVTVKVTDNGEGSLTDTKSFSVRVNEVNLAPVLNAIGDSTIEESVPFTFTAGATDADLPANNLTYSLVNSPAGATIDPATGVFSWTPTEAQGGNPNTPYTFTVRVTDDGVEPLSDEETITLTVNEVNSAPVLAAIGDKSGYWNNPILFNASATDSDLPANTLTFSLAGQPAGAAIDPSSGAFAWTPNSGQIGSHTFTVRVTDNGNPASSDEEIITVTVGRRPTAILYTGDFIEQYSDQQALSATLTDAGLGAGAGAGLEGKSVAFTIGAQGAFDSTDNSGVASTNLILTQSPIPGYSVVSHFAGDALYLPATDTDVFDITEEDARVYYTGSLFVNTTCATCGTATVTLSTTVKDITAETGDASHDSFEGDIRNATVTFINRDTNTEIATVPVGWVSSADKKIGTATYNWNVNIGSADSEPFTIGIRVNEFYTRDSSVDDEVVTVSKPIGTNFITGGGFLTMQNSSGVYAGTPGTKSNFGFNVKYNKSGKSLQGRVNVIVRSGGRVYQIKGNVMNTLTVNNSNPSALKAVYTGKANITDVTDPYNPVSLGGNNTFQMELTDKGEPGSSDTIGINVWSDAGGVMFSSNWNGTRTVEQLLGGGNLVVR